MNARPFTLGTLEAILARSYELANTEGYKSFLFSNSLSTPSKRGGNAAFAPSIFAKKSNFLEGKIFVWLWSLSSLTDELDFGKYETSFGEQDRIFAQVTSDAVLMTVSFGGSLE